MAVDISPLSVADALREAIAHHRAGRLPEAEGLYRAILRAQPGHPDAHHNLGVLICQSGRPADALPHLESALASNPASAQYALSHANALLQAGRAEEAILLIQAAMGRGLDSPGARSLRQGAEAALLAPLAALFQTGRHRELQAMARALLARQPGFGFVWKALGASLLAEGKSEMAVWRKAAELLPEDAEVHYNLGLALHNGGQPGDALACWRRTLEIRPGFAEAHNAMGNALQDLGQSADAVPCYRRALEIRPGFAEAHNNLGNALHKVGQSAEAAACYGRALAIRPDFAEPHYNLGRVLMVLGRSAEAAACCRRALALKPDFPEALNILGNALQSMGQATEAVACYRRALEIRPDSAGAYNNLGNTLQRLGQFAEAVACYRRALEISPDHAEAHSNLLFCLSHGEDVDAPTLFAEHCRFAERFEHPLRGQWPRHRNSPDPERRLQVGIVSGDLRDHAVAYFIEPVLAHLADHRGLALHGYHNLRQEDGVTRRLRALLRHWHPVAPLSDAALAEKIRADGIDILIDLSGHTAHNRLLTFARKPAPIQLTWIGYPNTTGLRAMDYVLMDPFNAPYGAYERYYMEKFARIPSSRTFLPFAGAPPVNELPALGSGGVTFGSFNSPGKLNQGTLLLWSRVLRAVPGSRLLLGNVGEGALRERLAEGFARCGVPAERVTFQPPLKMAEYLALHHQVDFILDTTPYTGGTTTNHALWMGVPVLTITGPSATRCLCAGILGRAGLTDWIADDADDFVRRAVEWSGRLEELARLRAGMRDRLLHSPLRQPRTVAKGLEIALRTMWRRWCAGSPVESFAISLEELSLDEGE